MPETAWLQARCLACTLYQFGNSQYQIARWQVLAEGALLVFGLGARPNTVST